MAGSILRPLLHLIAIWPHVPVFVLLNYTVSTLLKAKNTPLYNLREKTKHFPPIAEMYCVPPYTFQHYPTLGSATLYCTLITTAWQKIPWISSRDGNVAKNKNTLCSKMTATSAKTEGLGRGQHMNKNIFTRPKRASSSSWPLA